MCCVLCCACSQLEVAARDMPASKRDVNDILPVLSCLERCAAVLSLLKAQSHAFDDSGSVRGSPLKPNSPLLLPPPRSRALPHSFSCSHPCTCVCVVRLVLPCLGSSFPLPPKPRTSPAPSPPTPSHPPLPPSTRSWHGWPHTTAARGTPTTAAAHLVPHSPPGPATHTTTTPARAPQTRRRCQARVPRLRRCPHPARQTGAPLPVRKQKRTVHRQRRLPRPRPLQRRPVAWCTPRTKPKPKPKPQAKTRRSVPVLQRQLLLWLACSCCLLPLALCCLGRWRVAMARW